MESGLSAVRKFRTGRYTVAHPEGETMFGRLRRWWRERKDRRIFRLATPAGVRWVDPLPAARAMEAALGADWPTLVAKLYQPVPQVPPGMPPESIANVLAADRAARDEATRRITDAVCVALGLSSLAADGTGMTEQERLTAGIEFLAFLCDLSEAARPFANSPSPTG